MLILEIYPHLPTQFCFTEWNTHCSGVKHSKLANSKALQDMPKIDTFFKKRSTSEKHSTGDTLIHKKDYNTKRKKMNSCPGFFMEKMQICYLCMINIKETIVSMIHSISSAIMASGVFIPSTLLVSKLIIEKLCILKKKHVTIVSTIHQLTRFVLELNIWSVS